MNTHLIPFKILSTNHIIIDARVNNVSGKFLIDTGASYSCIDINKSKKFKLNFEKSKEIASSATNEIKETFISKKNSLYLDEWSNYNFEIILFDMKYVIETMLEKESIEIDGIIGSDILIKNDCCIDFKENTLLIIS